MRGLEDHVRCKRQFGGSEHYNVSGIAGGVGPRNLFLSNKILVTFDHGESDWSSYEEALFESQHGDECPVHRLGTNEKLDDVPKAAPKASSAGSVVEQTYVHALEERIRRLEQAVEKLLRAKNHKEQDDDNDGEVTRDPHFEWIEANRELLRTSYANSFVAMDPDRGVILHSTNAEDFGIKLAQLSQEDTDKVMAFHTSMFV